MGRDHGKSLVQPPALKGGPALRSQQVVQGLTRLCLAELQGWKCTTSLSNLVSGYRKLLIMQFQGESEKIHPDIQPLYQPQLAKSI